MPIAMFDLPMETVITVAIMAIAIGIIVILDKKSSVVMVYSWKMLLISIVLGGGLTISTFIDIIDGRVLPYTQRQGYLELILQLLFFGAFTIRGIWMSLTGNGILKHNRKEKIYQKVYNKLFGPWASIASWLGMILILLAPISIIFTQYNWFPILLLISGLLYHIWFTKLVNKHVKIEEHIMMERGEFL